MVIMIQCFFTSPCLNFMALILATFLIILWKIVQGNAWINAIAKGSTSNSITQATIVATNDYYVR